MPNGFFSQEVLEERTKLEFNYDDGPNCLKCGLYLKCSSPKMKYTGKGEKGVLIIGEYPGAAEDQQGEQLIGDAGQLLHDELDALGLDLNRDFWKTNALSCRPSTPAGTNRKPTKSEIKYCKPLVEKTIRDLNPKMIWLMGNTAVESMYTGRFSKLAISRWRKLCIPDRKTGKWIIPLFNPKDVVRNEYDENLKATFKRDLKWAASCINKKPFTWEDEREQVKCIYNFDEVISCLQDVLNRAANYQVFLYMDYETNALKPQWPGSKIATVSFSVDYNDTAVAFPYQFSDFFTRQQQTHIKAMWRKVIRNQNVACIAHNMKFEDAWTRKIFGVRPYSWVFDTMLAAHIEDNRASYSGLKFQSYINFGLEPYNKDVVKFLKASTGHFNKVDNAHLERLLIYNGLDTIMGMKLYNKQQKLFTLSENLQQKNRLSEAYALFHDGILALSDVQMNGVCIDEDYYKKEDTKLKTRTKELRDVKLPNSKEVQKFQEIKGRIFNVGSTKDLGELLYDVLELPKKLTTKDNYRVDIDALESIDIPFVKDLLELRKLEKAGNTYIAQFLREVTRGKIFPFYDLHIPRSYRSSSSLPNWQNIPSHDPEIGKLIRSGIFPSKGYKIAEIDYSSVEVRVAAIYTKDPTLLAEVTSKDADMHRDTALDIWILNEDELVKEIRYLSKSFNFGQFYGASYKSSATNLWKQANVKTKDDLTLKEHLVTKGIRNYQDFEQHCKEYTDHFWNERFVLYQQWKDEMNELYRKQGFIENKFGFRFTGYMSDRVVSNYPIQSTAFHILLHSLILINNVAKKEKWKTKIIGQIHDSVLLDIHPDEEEYVLKICMHIASTKMRELHPWITVPIPVDAEITKKNMPWYTKEEMKII